MNKHTGDYHEEDENDTGKVPLYRGFGLYVVLICGIAVSLLGLYLYLSFDPKKEYLIFDGDAFHEGRIAPLVFVFAGLIICIFPVYHLFKGNHKIK
jgi:hypothetical protein